ncbi:dynein axonemal heavy chain 2-like [Aethina tumida]|uniref:dynein axonemal heavy chain 2-like n=1 Tax=Aethina tumida TaxID=116153 RepID=UPI00214843DA|nr:dynein axonemal heavy chain 2-like [Aethina tumida]
MSLQIQASGGESESKEHRVSELANDVLSKVLDVIDYERTDKLTGLHKTPLDVVLLQEIQRYNKLLIKIKTSLEELGKAIEGFVVMSSELEDIFNCIYEARVPGEWLKGTKPSNPFAYNN